MTGRPDIATPGRAARNDGRGALPRRRPGAIAAPLASAFPGPSTSASPRSTAAAGNHDAGADGEAVKGLNDLQYTLQRVPASNTCATRTSCWRRTSVTTSAGRRSPGRPSRATTFRSQMAVKLFLDDEGTLGCLNLYSTNSRDIDPEDEHVAEVFAAHAAVALGHRARSTSSTRRCSPAAPSVRRSASSWSATTWTGIGPSGSSPRASSHSNLKVRDVAARIVESTERGEATASPFCRVGLRVCPAGDAA